MGERRFQVYSIDLHYLQSKAFLCYLASYLNQLDFQLEPKTKQNPVYDIHLHNVRTHAVPIDLYAAIE